MTFLFLQAKPQSYDSLVVENAQWTVMYDDDGTPWDDDMFGWLLRGDTVLNGLEYKKLYSRYFEEPNSDVIISQDLTGFLREDVENRIVYALILSPSTMGCDTLNDEYILFDFSYQVGDTSYLCSLTEELGPCELTDMWNEYLYGKDRNIFQFGGFAASFIDGVGHEFGLLESPVWNISGGVNTNLYTYCRGTDEECGVVYVKIDDPFVRNSFSIFPNPASDLVYLHFKDIRNHGVIKIQDVSGRCFLKTITNDEVKLDISGIPEGMYFVSISDGNNVFSSKKLFILR
jgi:hypothetical protein